MNGYEAIVSVYVTALVVSTISVHDVSSSSYCYWLSMLMKTIITLKSNPPKWTRAPSINTESLSLSYLHVAKHASLRRWYPKVHSWWVRVEPCTTKRDSLAIDKTIEFKQWSFNMWANDVGDFIFTGNINIVLQDRRIWKSVVYIFLSCSNMILFYRTNHFRRNPEACVHMIQTLPYGSESALLLN